MPAVHLSDWLRVGKGKPPEARIIYDRAGAFSDRTFWTEEDDAVRSLPLSFRKEN
jgi:hypothetical protein